MTVTINGTTGIDKVQDASIGQEDLKANVVGNGPVFSICMNSAQSIPNITSTKILFDTIITDTDNICDVTVDYIVRPKVAGYYQILGGFYVIDTTGNTQTMLFKNGSFVNTSPKSLKISDVIYLNGSTDYIELFVFQSSGGSLDTSTNRPDLNYLKGYLVRAA